MEALYPHGVCGSPCDGFTGRTIMKIGYMSGSLSPELTKAFDLAAAVGAEGVQVCYRDEQAALLRQAGHGEWLAQQAKARGLEVCGIVLSTLCSGLPIIDPVDSTPATRVDNMPAIKELFSAACGVAKAAGTNLILLPFFGKNIIEVDRELNRAIEGIGQLVDIAEEAGVVIGVESTINFNQCRFLLGQFADTDVVKIYQDTGNALGRKLDLPTGLRDLGLDSLAGVHLKDVKMSMSSPPDYNIRLGTGDVQFRAVLNALQAIGYDGWLVLETPPGDNPLANGKADMAFARNLLGK